MSNYAFYKNPLLLTDGYKLGHLFQYPAGTQYVYATWVPRSNQYFKAADEAVFFGLQYFIKEYLIRRFNEDFFKQDVNMIVKDWNIFLDNYLGSHDNCLGEVQIRALHKLGYLPILIKALDEGTLSPVGHNQQMGVPQLSIVNTNPEFFWLPNFLESIMSSSLFLPTTSATSAYLYKKELVRHARKTGYLTDLQSLGFSMHDFSMRGMALSEAALVSGMGHLAVFNGSETLSAIPGVCEFYGADYTKELVAGTVAATEHSVMSAAMSEGFTSETEKANYIRLLTEVYPDAPFLSIVSDTRDYKDVVANILPAIKNIIMSRPGRLVIRPDSGDPVDIICGDPNSTDEFYRKGTYESLWDNFGGTINDRGFKVLDGHVGIIYGDAITLARQKEIYRRLEEKGFAATNLVLGVGSYTYQYISRDTLGFALKTSAVMINGKWRVVYKEPKTAGQTINKNSYRGFVKVLYDKGQMIAVDGVPYEEEGGLLTTVFKDGKLIKTTTLSEVRNRINIEILK
jgi:nicotinamide phosphoribosyltransferase